MVIGITGGVGCGKSTVVGLLQQRYGAKVLIADNMGHAVMEKGTPAYDKICRLFGNGILAEDKTIDRKLLSEIVYGEEDKLNLLNSIIHPYVRREIEKQLLAWKDEPLVVIETAILFETGCDAFCDEIWGVVTDNRIRLERLMQSRGYTKEKAEAIMAKQMKEKEYKKRCHKILHNDGNMEELEKKLDEMMETGGKLS